MTRQNQERGRKRVRKAMMVVLCSNVNGASIPILLVLIVHYKVQVSAPLLHHPRCLLYLGSVISGCMLHMVSSSYCS